MLNLFIRFESPLQRTMGAVGIVALLASFLGCTASEPVGLVTGTVTYQNKPVKEGAIIFEVSGHRPMPCKIVDGKIVSGNSRQDGVEVPVGIAAIAINATEAVTSNSDVASGDVDEETAPNGVSEMVAVRRLLPQRYGNPATSDLSVEIKRGENVLQFDLVK